MESLYEMNARGAHEAARYGNYVVTRENNSSVFSLRYQMPSGMYGFLCSGMTFQNARGMAITLERADVDCQNFRPL